MCVGGVRKLDAREGRRDRRKMIEINYGGLKH